MRRILLMVIALILYGSLYPWRFHAVQLGVSPLWILLHSWPQAMNRYLIWDIAVNVALYVPLGLFAYLAIETRGALRIAGPILLAALLSAGVEMLQLFDDGRQCSGADLVSNISGAAVGVGLGAIYWHKLGGARPHVRVLHLSGALLLICCWLGYQIFPAFPEWGRTRLAGKLSALGPVAATSPVGVLLVAAEWLALACLLERLALQRSSRLLAFFVLALPARLLVTGRTLAWSDLFGTAAALGLWTWLPRGCLRRAVPMLLALALLIGELAPFHFAPAAPFNWVPFRSLFESSWQSGFVVLFRKSFWYGSVIWFWRNAGYPLLAVIAVTAATLGLLEAAQIYLPGRTPEITDAVLAVLMGVMLWLVDSRPQPH